MANKSVCDYASVFMFIGLEFFLFFLPLFAYSYFAGNFGEIVHVRLAMDHNVCLTTACPL